MPSLAGRSYPKSANAHQGSCRCAAYTGKMVEGYQGVAGSDAFLDDRHVVATAKHFLGDGGTEGGKDQGDNPGNGGAKARLKATRRAKSGFFILRIPKTRLAFGFWWRCRFPTEGRNTQGDQAMKIKTNVKAGPTPTTDTYEIPLCVAPAAAPPAAVEPEVSSG